MKKESDETKKTGKDPQKRAPHNRRVGPRFEWGEVDNVSQEDMLLPAKKKKGNRRKHDRIESTLTVGAEEADPYAIKPTSPHPADDPAIPSYGRRLNDDDDEYNIFLRNAERADRREKERELAKKEQKPKKTAPPKETAPAGKESVKEDVPVKKKPVKERSLAKERSPLRQDASSRKLAELAMIDNLRAGIGELRKIGVARIKKCSLTEDTKETFLSSLSLMENLLDVVGRLVSFPQEADAARKPDRMKKAPIAEKPTEPKEPTPKTRPVRKDALPEPEVDGELPDTVERFAPVEPPRKKELPKKEKPKKQRPIKEPPHPFDEAAPAGREESDRFFELKKNWKLGGAVLSDAMLAALAEVHYEKPTPIQAGTIPLILAGKDLMGQSRTGSGKTAAFMIPIIEKIDPRAASASGNSAAVPPGDDPVALIVVPTRELAVQIRDETAKLAHNREIAIVACYGGKPIADQVKKMRGGVDIVIGTPGRILDLAKRSALRLSSLKWVVLDEADRMLDIGFRPDIERILRQTPRERQTLLFSATLADEVVRLAQRYMNEPETCDFSENEIAADTIEQFYITVDRDRKFEALVRLLRREDPQQAIVFCRTKRGVDRLGSGLIREFKNWAVSAIHGDLTQSNRDNIMRSFRAGKIKILVATDVVGRGIDVSGISHIINYDIPEFCDDYVHRVGRTGRMGREGVAYTLVTSEEGNELTRIEMRINRLLQRTELEGFEAFTRPEETKNAEPKEPKPVYGKPLRRVRRAL